MISEYIYETEERIYEENTLVERMVIAHNQGDVEALNELSADVIAQVQFSVRENLGAVVELFHGSEVELDSAMLWRENSSFTDEFDIEFAGESGYIVVARVPVERVKFYIHGEREFVVSAGRLDCDVFTVREYFGL